MTNIDTLLLLTKIQTLLRFPQFFFNVLWLSPIQDTILYLAAVSPSEFLILIIS